MAAIVKMRKGDYTNTLAVENVIHYITRTRSCDTDNQAFVFGGLGVDEYDPGMMCQQFRQVQSIYQKENHGVRVMHEVITFLPFEIIDINGINRIREIAYKFASIYYLSGFQVVYAVHTDSNNTHIHYAVNATNFIDGYKFNYKLPELEHRREYLNRVMQECLGRVPALQWIDDIGWAPRYYNELCESCEHSGFLI